MKKLAIVLIAATFMAVVGSVPKLHAQEAAPLNPQGVLKPEPFADVPPDHWAWNAVEQMRQSGLIDGFPDGTFKGKRPMTRYELAQMVARMITGLNNRMEELGNRLAKVEELQRGGLDNAGGGQTGVTKEQVQQMIQDAIAAIPPTDLSNYVTRDDLATLQKLVDEFSNELKRLNVDVDAVKRQLADLTARVDAVEADLAKRTVVFGYASVIGMGAAKSDQTYNYLTGTYRPVTDHDGRLLPDTTSVLSQVQGLYDLDLGILGKPYRDVRVLGVVNVGNYLGSYDLGHGHARADANNDVVRPYKVLVNVPFQAFGSERNQELTVGVLGVQLSPYTFKAIDPDTYTFIPREDSGEVLITGASTNWRFGGLTLGAFAGTRPRDGRLMPLNLYTAGTGPMGLASTFGTVNPAGTTRPITEIGNVAGARLAYGQPAVSPFVASEAPVGTAEQLNYKPTTPMGGREVAAAPDMAAAPMATPEAETGVTVGPLRNTVIGLNWLDAGGVTNNNNLEDARAQVYSVDLRTKLGPIRIEGEAAQGVSKTGNTTVARPKALDDSAVDVRGYYTFSLGSAADLELGGGWRSIELGYLTPGYWGSIGSWKNPRGIQGPLAEVRVPLRWNIASFLRNMVLRGSAEFYRGTKDLTTAGVAVGQTDPSEDNLHIDRYLAGLQFALTSRNTVDLGVEQVLRNYVAERATDAPLSLPTMGLDGGALVGDRIKNTETYINLGVGHSFTPDVSMKLLYQLIDFQKYAVDRSNQPANNRGYVATAQLGVRF